MEEWTGVRRLHDWRRIELFRLHGSDRWPHVLGVAKASVERKKDLPEAAIAGQAERQRQRYFVYLCGLRHVAAERNRIQIWKSAYLGIERKCSGSAAIKMASVAVFVASLFDISRVKVQSLAAAGQR